MSIVESLNKNKLDKYTLQFSMMKIKASIEGFLHLQVSCKKKSMGKIDNQAYIKRLVKMPERSAQQSVQAMIMIPI